MGKTLHILPSDGHWKGIVTKWIGNGPDKKDHTIISYPVPTNIHYLPEDFRHAEMMKVALSFDKEDNWGADYLYDCLKDFEEPIRCAFKYEKIVVWHAEDADSRLLLALMAKTIPEGLFAVDITPKNRRMKCPPQEDPDVTFVDAPVFMAPDVDWRKVTRESYTPCPVVSGEFETTWRCYAGEDAQDCPILINQFGDFFHPFRTYLYSDIFHQTKSLEPMRIDDLSDVVHKMHPQFSRNYIRSTTQKMISEGFLRSVEREWVQKYENDVEGEWNRYPRDFVYRFVVESGLDITMSEDDMKAEYLREKKDVEDVWGQGHLTRQLFRDRKEAWKERMLIKWAKTFNDNWGWYHLLEVMKAKLEMMVEYMRKWSPVANGPLYAAQMERAISLMEIIIDYGGQYDYESTPGEEGEILFEAKNFIHYVNLRNKNRFPAPQFDDYAVWCEPQRVRFCKAWHLLWRIFQTRLLTWED